MGWEPVTAYEYDDAGRMVSSRPEVEWDETERAWMLALDEYDASLCPLCGLPRSECQDPSAENRAEAGAPIRCHVTTARIRAQEADKRAESGALLWPAGLRP